DRRWRNPRAGRPREAATLASLFVAALLGALLHLLDEPLDLLLAHLVPTRTTQRTGGLGRQRGGIDRAEAIVRDFLQVRKRVIFARFVDALVDRLEKVLGLVLVPLGLVDARLVVHPELFEAEDVDPFELVKRLDRVVLRGFLLVRKA